MMNPFDWLRTRVKQAFVDGCADGLAAIDTGEVRQLQERVQLALASPSPAAAGDTSPADPGDTSPVRGKRGAK